MNVVMSGLDYNKATIELREQLSFTRSAVLEAVREIADIDGVFGAVLLSTCNRTEIYISCEDDMSPDGLLCSVADVDYEHFADAFVTRRGEDCIRHLMELACGLRSQILGEDQILTQVKTAAAIAREVHSIDPTLETLFRNATSCGKALKNELRLTSLPSSAAHCAVDTLEKYFTELSGKRALVIGNGEMGRLAATLLHEAGCDVSVTLRSYRHGETLVPAGCDVVPYDDRYLAVDGADIVISATTSPHYTIAPAPLAEMSKIPEVMVDLAIPRDIDPDVEEITTLYNVDSLGQRTGIDARSQMRVDEIIAEHTEKFHHWDNYRKCMPAIDELKEAVLERVLRHVEGDDNAENQAELAAIRTVELLTGGLSDCLSPKKIRSCAEGIRSRTR